MSVLHKSKAEIDSERQLIEQAKLDPRAFAPLYERYYKPIFLFVFKRTGDEDLTSDITSEVFLKAMNGLAKYVQKDVPFSAWLYRIAFNEVAYYYRVSKNKRVLSIDDHQFELFIEEITDGESEEKLTAVLKGIQALDIKDVQYIEMRFFEERSFKEIAGILGITENNAKVRTYRVLDKIKKMILK